jgi:hypothetical protein
MPAIDLNLNHGLKIELLLEVHGEQITKFSSPFKFER